MRIDRVTGFPQSGQPGLFWLGQAGFWIEAGEHRVLIDPYLSDSLARKYAGKQHDHKRMMPPPITIEDLPRPDLVLITHAHTDHMDPDTLDPLHQRFPEVPFLVPAASLTQAKQRIGENAALIAVDADQTRNPLPGLTITTFPAAHEDLRRDAQGQHHFLGYGIECGGLKIYHSGDSIPFAGLRERIEAFAPDIMLLPVNGRDADRLAAGIPGNFTLDEAIALAQGCAALIPHHFGMFAFNTIAPEAIEAAAAAISSPHIAMPRSGETLLIKNG